MYGVILMGGQSSRMGTDKATLLWENEPLYEVAAQKLMPFCTKVFLSVNRQQSLKKSYAYSTIIDYFENSGPAGGLLTVYSAMSAPFIILACDMPLIRTEDIDNLLRLHRTEDGCSLYFNPMTGYFEPMLAVWECHMLERLQTHFQDGGRSLQTFLLSNNIRQHPVPDPHYFTNINTMEDYSYLKSL